jgi:uncharacterized FlaG/YvyC family protein
MDIKDATQVSAVSTSPAPTGRHPILTVPQPDARVPERAAAAPPPPAQELSQTRQAIAEQVSGYLQSNARSLEFQVDGATGEPVVVVRDGEGNVIRRIPGEAALQMMRRLNAQSGTLVDSVI